MKTAVSSTRRLIVAVAGNPNSGKTTLFNALTGAHAHIGNYPGITVERRCGTAALPRAGRVEMVDVPGTYSLTARSADEEVAINALLGRKGEPRPDAVLVVLDATSLERNLYFLLQVLEFDLPVVAAVNMVDAAREEGIVVDAAALGETLGIPVVLTCARRREGIAELRAALDDRLAAPAPRPVGTATDWFWTPGPELTRDLDSFDALIREEVRFPLETPGSRRAFALWLLGSLQNGNELIVRPRLREHTRRVRADIAAAGRDLDAESISRRYAAIDALAPRFVRRSGRERPDPTDRLDAFLTHPLWGSLVFLLVMGAIFQALFSWSAPAMDALEGAFAALGRGASAVLPAGFLHGLLVDGIIAGVGGVVVFLPQILFLFLFISLLEGSGYLARAAFLVDRLMRRIGLHGQAFVPMLSGYACAVPAIMATRTIENPRDRLLTLMVVPLMSCSARLPVYTLVIALLFPAEQKIGFLSAGTLVLLGLYLLSAVLAFAAAAVLGRTVFRGRTQPLLLELPPYRVPDWRTVGLCLWERARVFLTTAGTIILAATIVLWVLLSFPGGGDLEREYDALRAQAGGDPVELARLDAEEQSARLRASYAGRLGTALEPLLRPLGFDWKIGIGLIGAFAAREVFVSTMGVVYGIGDDADEANPGLRQAMRRDRHPDGSPVWTPLTGVGLLVFFMIAMQCMSTLAITQRETRSWRWPAFMLAYLSGGAYLATLLVHQGGKLLGLG